MYPMPAGKSSTSVNEDSSRRTRSTVTTRLLASAARTPISSLASSPSASISRTCFSPDPVVSSCPATFSISSPGKMPAAAAGEFVRTDATFGSPSSTATRVRPESHSRCDNRCERPASSPSSRNTTEGSLARINASSKAALASPFAGAKWFSVSKRAPSPITSHKPFAHSVIAASGAAAGTDPAFEAAGSSPAHTPCIIARNTTPAVHFTRSIFTACFMRLPVF